MSILSTLSKSRCCCRTAFKFVSYLYCYPLLKQTCAESGTAFKCVVGDERVMLSLSCQPLAGWLSLSYARLIRIRNQRE
jgi:hypothetical protein